MSDRTLSTALPVKSSVSLKQTMVGTAFWFHQPETHCVVHGFFIAIASLIWVEDLLMVLKDVAFRSSRASSSTVYLKNPGESPRTTTCLRTVAGGKQGYAPCRILSLHKASVLHQSNLMEIIRLLQR